jgi:predicted permease
MALSHAQEVLVTVLPVLVMLGLGVLARKTGIISREGIGAMKRMVMDISLPAVLLGAFAGAEYTLGSLLLPLVMFGVCLALLGFGFAGKKLLKLRSPYAPYMATGFEAGMLGYALFAMLYGQAHTASFALLDLGQVLFVFTVYKVLLVRTQGGAMTGREILASMLTSPTIWAILAGVTLGATGLYKAMGAFGGDRVLSAVTDFVAGPTAAVILLAIGYDLKPDTGHLKEGLKTLALRLPLCLLMMGLMLLTTRAMFPGDEYIRGAVLLMFLLPPPFVLPIIADDPKERGYASSTLCLSTMVTILCFALLAWLA